MKKVLFILAFAGLIFTSCKKDSSNNNVTPGNVIVETEGGVTTTHKGAVLYMDYRLLVVTTL